MSDDFKQKEIIFNILKNSLYSNLSSSDKRSISNSLFVRTFDGFYIAYHIFDLEKLNFFFDTGYNLSRLESYFKSINWSYSRTCPVWYMNKQPVSNNVTIFPVTNFINELLELNYLLIADRRVVYDEHDILKLL